ncbi:MAG TPA: DUF397 domain-containing protein [Candidatus Limnocylindrales bacterium]|nr:DUF397 domain-containing protein [Candidatus Limnocylindrales bacterium]
MTDHPTPDLVWRKSIRSGGTECVEVAARDGIVLIRDSKDPDGPILAVNVRAWRAFIEAVKDGEI